MRAFQRGLVALSVACTVAPGGTSAWAADRPTCTGLGPKDNAILHPDPNDPDKITTGPFYTTTLFTDRSNTVTPYGGWAGVPQITGSEASTTQVLELISQRRIQETQDCPSGLVRADGICRSPVTDQSAPTASSASASKKERS